jgi:Flp pilus assembly CpaF family ATPase
MVNGPAQIFVKRHRGISGYHDEVFHDDEHVVRTLTKILDDASAAHRKLDATEGLQDAQLDVAIVGEVRDREGLAAFRADHCPAAGA